MILLQFGPNDPFFVITVMLWGELECGYDLHLLYLGNVTMTTDQTKQVGKNNKKKKMGKNTNSFAGMLCLGKGGFQLVVGLAS